MKSLKYEINLNIEKLTEKEVKDIIRDLSEAIDIFCTIRKKCYPLIDEYVITSRVVEL